MCTERDSLAAACHVMLSWSYSGVKLGGILLLSGTACSDSEQPQMPSTPAPFVMSDSSGVRIIENQRDTATLPIWVLDTVPVVRIGNVEGNAAESFGSVVDAVQLSDGRLVVADNQAAQIRFFTPDGIHINSVGGRGEGPGEYQLMFSMERFAGDSLFILDSGLSRATVLSPDGETIRVVAIRPPVSENVRGLPLSGPVYPVSPLPDGGWLAVGQALALMPPGTRPPAVIAFPVTLIHYDDHGDVVAAPVPVADMQYLFAPIDPDEARSTAGYQVMSPSHLLSAHVALRRGRFYVGESSHFEVREYGADGSLVRSVRYPRLDRPYTDEEFRARRQRSLDGARTEARRRSLEMMLDPAFKPRFRPSMSRIEIDADRHLWVYEWGGNPAKPARWIVFDSVGIATAVAEIPRRHRIRRLGLESVITIDRDELDVQYVTVRRWIEPSGE